MDDQLAGVDVVTRRMFGCVALYLNDKIFAIIDGGQLFLKTDDETRLFFIDEGMEPFRPDPTTTLKSYYEAPASLLENSVRLKAWVLTHFGGR